jgi:hypothetical protein
MDGQCRQSAVKAALVISGRLCTVEIIADSRIIFTPRSNRANMESARHQLRDHQGLTHVSIKDPLGFTEVAKCYEWPLAIGAG